MLDPLQTMPTILPAESFLSSTFHPAMSSTAEISTPAGTSSSMRTVGIAFSVGTRIVYCCVAPAADSLGRTPTCANNVPAIQKVSSAINRVRVQVIYYGESNCAVTVCCKGRRRIPISNRKRYMGPRRILNEPEAPFGPACYLVIGRPDRGMYMNLKVCPAAMQRV